MGFRKLSKHKPAFSLLEFLIAFVMIGLVSFLIAAIYFTQLKIFSNQNKAIEIASQNKIALDEITNQIREAGAVPISCGACGGDSSGVNVLILALWPIDSNKEPIDPGISNYDYIVYKRNAVNNTITKKVIPSAIGSRAASEKIVASSVSDLQFVYDVSPPSSAEATITVTTTGTNLGNTQTNTQSAKGVLRNK